jgi:predicted translin family RNA/ssDNA-binding protein
VIQHIHEVLLSIDYSFELADAMETFTRDLSNHLLQEIMSENHLESKVLLRNKPITISNNQENSSDSQSNHKPTESLENQDDESKSNSTAVQPVKFSIRLHNDDVSIFGDVVNQLCNALACSNYEAQEMTNRIDQIGEEIIDHRTLLRCCDVVGNLIRGALNVSVAPVWLTHQMELIQKLLRWLHILSTTSDGLAQIVSESLRKKRALNVVGFDSILLDLKEKYKSSEDFMTALHSNLHVRMEKLVQRTLGEDEMFKWIEKTEKLKQNMFQFRGSFHSTQNKYTSGDLDCSNIFVKSFVEAIISNRLHDLHENVQEAVKQVVSKFYKPSEDLSNVSALDLLIQNDCVLKKSTAEISHSLLREHMLEPSFRISTLESYATSFVKTTKSFLKGLGTSTDRIFDFAVQFLTVPDLVKNYTKEELVKHPERPDVVKQLLYALDMVFRTAVKPLEGDIGRVDVNHPAITNQKYKVSMNYYHTIRKFIFLYTYNLSSTVWIISSMYSTLEAYLMNLCAIQKICPDG